MDKITLERIEKAHPSIREELLAEYTEINNRLPKGVRLRFAHVYRTPKEQDELFNKKPKVTNARGWQSIHNYGLAFDIVILYDKDGNGTFETASWALDKHWMNVVTYFKSKGWEWGGDWKKFKDAPHFQKAFGNTWQTLKQRVYTGIVIKDENGIVYPIVDVPIHKN
jgi:peptidoglycan L-alanyl-D-glutamate endopeptidase CwlK